MGLMTERDMRAAALGMAVGAAVGAGVALLLAPKRGTELRDDFVRSAAKAGRTVAGGVARVRGSARRALARSTPLAGAWRADDSADLVARSRDMVAEGGPDGE